MATDTPSERRTDRGSRWQVLAALAVGGVLVLIGVLGFLLEPEEGELFGIFGVNALHNAVHLLTGLLGLAAGYVAAGGFADEYNKYGGLVYLLLVVLWLVVPGVLASLLNVGLPDTLLHLGLGVVMAGVGFVVADRAG